MPVAFSAFSITLVGRFPELTPVRSQTTRPWLSTLEAGDILGKWIFGRSKKLQFLVRWKGYSLAHDQWVNREDMAADDLIRIYERENPHDAPVTCPAQSKRIRATTVDFDSPEIASSQEASVEPADISAARTRTH